MTDPKLTVLDVKRMVSKTLYGRSSIYEFGKPDSARFDPEFPQRIKLGPNRVGWIEAEVDDWLQKKREKSRQSSEPRNFPICRGA